jgi:tetratricopeptide (TPR) repeat protein
MAAPGPAGDAKQADVAITADVDDHSVAPQATDAKKATCRSRPLRAIIGGLCRNRRVFVALGLLLALAATAVALYGRQAVAWYHFRAAKSAIQAYHNPQAIRHLQASLLVWPNDPDVLLLAARAARRARAYDECELALNKYRQVRGLDEAYSFEQLLLTAERDVDQVAAVCRRHVEQGHPDAPLILEALTRGYLRQYRLSEARFCLDLWLGTQPDNPHALCLDGELRLDYELAIDRAGVSYRRAIELDPENEEARQGLAIVLLTTKNFSEAAEHLEYLRRCQPDNLRVQVGLAECRSSLGDRDEAIRLVDEVLARQPEYAPALSVRGRLAADGGQYKEAETWLRQAIAINPSDHEARYSLVLCLFNTDRTEEANREEKGLKQLEDDTKRFNEIVARDLAKRPDDPALHSALGEILIRTGHADAGVRWLNSALRLDHEYAPARKALTEYYERAKSRQQAKP